MSRKDYELIAAAIAATKQAVLPEHHGALTYLAERLALDLKADNPRFAHDRFVEAAIGAPA